MWDCMRGGGREGEGEGEGKGEGGGEREKQPLVKTTRHAQYIRQNHSTSTTHKSIDTTSKKF
jgi:hypothetical protein